MREVSAKDRELLTRALELFVATSVCIVGWDKTLDILDAAGDIARGKRAQWADLRVREMPKGSTL